MALDGFLILWQDKHLQNMTVVQHYTLSPNDIGANQMGGTGLEPVTSCVSSRTLRTPKQCNSQDLQNSPKPTCTDTCTDSPEHIQPHPPTELQDLADIVAAWTRLPDAIKSAILALVKAAEHVE